jgi:hypothetical protein
LWFKPKDEGADMRASQIAHLGAALNYDYGDPISQLRNLARAGYTRSDRVSEMRYWLKCRMINLIYRKQVEQMLDAACRGDLEERTALQNALNRSRRLSSLHTSNPAAFFAALHADAAIRGQYKLVLLSLRDSNCELDSEFFESEFAETLLSYFGFTYFEDAIIEDYEVCECGYCDERVRANSTTNVYTDGYRDEHHRACNDCRVEHGFYCEITGAWYDGDDCESRTTNEGETFCLEACEDRLVEYDDDDDEWVRTDRQGMLAGYHGALRPWRNGVIPERAIGVELELGFADGSRGRDKFLKKLVGTQGRFKNDMPFSCERDGSLDEVPGGMEIISDPLTFHEGYRAADAPWRWLLSELREFNAEGWKWRAYAGIHVNMDTRHVSEEDVLKYAVFISNAAALSKFISGRRKIYGRNNDDDEEQLRLYQYSGGYKKKEAHTYRKLNISRALGEVFRDDKYAPVHRRTDTCLETRIFGANIKYEGFMSCVEYCVAVMEFVQTRDTVDIFSLTISAEFRHWLGGRVGKYPNLAARIGVIPTIGAATSSSAKIIPLRAVA